MAYFIDESEALAHYGRKGMKWYQHIFGENARENRAYKRASKAANTLDSEKTRLDKGTAAAKVLSDAESNKTKWDKIDAAADKYKLLGKAKDYTEFKRLQKENAVKEAKFTLYNLGFNSQEDFNNARAKIAKAERVLNSSFKKLSRNEYGRNLAEDLLKEFEESSSDDRFNRVSEKAKKRITAQKAKQANLSVK